MITRESIDRVINGTHVEEVIGDFVALKKRGANLLGLCPFHQEKSPSFTVSPAKGLYKCFGCGRAGNAVGFIMDHENLSFPEAIRYLAGRFGLAIEETEQQSDEAKEESKTRESIIILLEFAHKHYVSNLWESPEGIEKGLSYFETRGYKEETIRKFGLGHALSGFEHFTPYALKNGFKQEYLIAAGLSKVSEKTGKLFDFFNGRVIFPIHGLNGKVLGFAGRILEAGSFGGKYLNSPETAVYNKRDILYGLYFSRHAIKREDDCLLVEGYTDVITLHQNGVENVVASSGTSLTAEQARLISRFSKNITLLYDGDNAGIKAAVRGVDILLAAGLDIRICILPESEDPDSFTIKNGGEALREYIKATAKNFVIFTAERLNAEASNDPLKKSEAARDILKSIKVVPDPLKRRLYLDECARIMGMDVQMLGFELRKLVQADKGVPAEFASSKQLNDKEVLPSPPILDGIETQKGFEQERALARLLIKSGHVGVGGMRLLEMFLAYLQSESIEIGDDLSRKVLEYATEHRDDERWTGDDFFLRCEEEEINRYAAQCLAEQYILSPKWEEHEIFVETEESNYIREASDVISRLKIVNLQAQHTVLQQSLEEHKEDEEKVIELMHEIHKVQQEIRDKAGLLGMVVVP